ncbi:F-box protein [Raphanus sativus]|nr:F-box protein [Raphanus sativus]
MINPLDAKTAFFWSKKRQRLLYFNLLNGEYVIHKQMKGTSNGQTNIPSSPVSNHPGARIYLKISRDMYYTIEQSYLVPFVLPQWLHRIPQSTVRIKQPTTTINKRPFTIQEKGKVKAVCVYKEKPDKSQQKPNMLKDIPSKNRTHGKVGTAIHTDAIKLSNPFEALDDDLPE